MTELAPLLNLLQDDSLNDLMFNGCESAFAERHGKMEAVAHPWPTPERFEAVVGALAGLKSISGSVKTLQFDGILPDGSRFHVTLPPLSPFGPTLTVRRFSPAHRGLENMIAQGTCSAKAGRFLEACVQGRLNILISGATGAGKTTLLNALCSRLDTRERVVTIEDIPEIQLNHPNWVRLVAVPAADVSIRSCLVGSLRMRPDRIVVGECRSDETLDMLQAMNTGHDGGMTTLHANSTGDALVRLESLILFHAGAEIPLRALRRQIVDAIDLVVQMRKGPDGRRQIEEILELVGMEGDVITRQPLFKQTGEKAARRLLGTGHAPTFLKRLEERGAGLPKNFFDPAAFES